MRPARIRDKVKGWRVHPNMEWNYRPAENPGDDSGHQDWSPEMLRVFHSFPDPHNLLKRINDAYGVGVTELNLYRDMIGSVYFLRSDDSRYVFKLFRHTDTEQALQSLDIVQYLRTNDHPVVTVVPAQSGQMYLTLAMPEGQRIGVLFDFVEGKEPKFETDIECVGRQIGELHNLMDAYPKPLIQRGKEFFIDRYIDILKESRYNPARVDELVEYGNELWRTMERLPQGFCHGDMHSGNMLKTSQGTYVLFDFDVVSYAYPIIDVTTLSDKTDYNHLDEAAYEATRGMFERFYQGYSKERTLRDAEVAAIVDYIAMRHYELNGTVIRYRSPIEGQQWLPAFLDQQYGWLMKWKELCERKRQLQAD